MRHDADLNVTPATTYAPNVAPKTNSRRISPFVGYGMQRGLVESLFGARGIALAAVLGAEWFGVWSLVRLGQQYAALGGIGLIRGLEVEVSAPQATDRAGAERESAKFAQATFAWFVTVFGALALCAGVVAWFASDDRTSAIFGGIGIGLLTERIWLYSVSYMRARGLLSRLGWNEVISASLHLVFATALAFQFGIWGALVGFPVAHLIGISLISRDVQLRPRWSVPRIKTLARIGFPVSFSQFLYTLMTSVDRLVVGAFLGIEALGLYAFAVAVSGLGSVIGFTFRTVLFPGVFRIARGAGPKASTEYLDLAVFPFAWLLAPAFGLVALMIAPAVQLWLPQFVDAVPALRIFMFIGIVQGINTVVQLGVVAHERQRVLPLITGGAVIVNLLLALGCVAAGLGLGALAAAALLTRLAHVTILILMARDVVAWRDRLHIAGRVSVPILFCGGLVVAIGSFFPITDAISLGAAIAIYAIGLLLLAPGIVGGLRGAARLERETR